MQNFLNRQAHSQMQICTMHVFLFVILNVDVRQKGNCCIISNLISSENKQACPKSKDTLRSTCLDTGNV